MSTAAALEKYVAALPEGKAFATREVLHLGTRSAIDQGLYSMVKAGKLIRWARGIFIRAEKNSPSYSEAGAAFNLPNLLWLRL